MPRAAALLLAFELLLGLAGPAYYEIFKLDGDSRWVVLATAGKTRTSPSLPPSIR